MNLPGRLKLATLGDLLGVLHRDGASGVLELVEAVGANAGRKHRVFFAAGLVDGVHTELETPRLGEVLERHGLVDREALAGALYRLAQQPERRVGEILVRDRVASAFAVSAALRFQLRARLDSVFRLSDAFVRFHVRRADEAGHTGWPLSPREFLHGRPRARARAFGGAPREGRAVNERRASAYRTLGLEPGADAAAVRRKFRQLAAEHHPDRYPRAAAGELASLVRRLSQITAAYHELGV